LLSTSARSDGAGTNLSYLTDSGSSSSNDGEMSAYGDDAIDPLLGSASSSSAKCGAWP
jgi:hypothetical protein